MIHIVLLMASIATCFTTLSIDASDTSNIIEKSIDTIHTYVNIAQSYSQSPEINNGISKSDAFSCAKNAYTFAKRLYAVDSQDSSIIEAYTRAASTLGAFYHDGKVVDANYDKALKYYTKLDFRNDPTVKYMKALIRSHTSFTHNQRQEILNELENIKKEIKNPDDQADIQELATILQKSMKPVTLALEDNSQSTVELQIICPINNHDIDDLIENAKNDDVIPLVMCLTIVDQNGNKDFLYASGKQLFAWLYSKPMDLLLSPEKVDWKRDRKTSLDRNNRIENVDFFTYDLDKQQLIHMCNEQALFKKDSKGYYNRAYLAAQGAESYDSQLTGLSKLTRIHSENSLNQKDAYLAQYYCNKILAKKSKLSSTSEINELFLKGISRTLAYADLALAIHCYRAKEHDKSYLLFEKAGLQTSDAHIQSSALLSLSQILFRTISDANGFNNLSHDMVNQLKRVSFCIERALTNTDLSKQSRKDLLREQSSISALLLSNKNKKFSIISKEISKTYAEDITQKLTNKIKQQNFDVLLARFKNDLALCTDTQTTCNHLYKAHDALKKAESLGITDRESLARISNARRSYEAKRLLLPKANTNSLTDIWTLD